MLKWERFCKIADDSVRVCPPHILLSLSFFISSSLPLSLRPSTSFHFYFSGVVVVGMGESPEGVALGASPQGVAPYPLTIPHAPLHMHPQYYPVPLYMCSQRHQAGLGGVVGVEACADARRLPLPHAAISSSACTC